MRVISPRIRLADIWIQLLNSFVDVNSAGAVVHLQCWERSLWVKVNWIFHNWKKFLELDYSYLMAWTVDMHCRILVFQISFKFNFCFTVPLQLTIHGVKCFAHGVLTRFYVLNFRVQWVFRVVINQINALKFLNVQKVVYTFIS